MYGNKAFTLLELAIVLVIIGLLAGGITGGIQIIHTAKLHNVISEFIRHQANIVHFQDKFKYYPGDFPSAYNYFGTACAESALLCNGNGNWSLDDNLGERIQAWRHLGLAHLVNTLYSGKDAGTPDFQPGTNVPASVFNNSYYFLTHTASSGRMFGYAGNAMQLVSYHQNSSNGSSLNAQDAYYIDRKMDDGKANGGQMFVLPGAGMVNGQCIDSSNPDAAEFILTDLATTCRLWLWLDKTY